MCPETDNNIEVHVSTGQRLVTRDSLRNLNFEAQFVSSENREKRVDKTKLKS